MTAPLTFTLDLEDHRPDDDAPIRFPDATRRILDHLAAREIVGTFFVVGSAAEHQPELIRAIAAAGHEVALHCWQHRPLVDHDRESFRADVTRGRALLEDLAGTEVVGYRAPAFSLVASTTWATDLLVEEGFRYSSSVLPAANPLYGYPGAPRQPFLWPSGLAEFPVPIVGVSKIQVPYLGGTYLRLIPRPVIAAAHRRGDSVVPWTYLHPYDVDPGEPYWKVGDAGWMSPLLWLGRTRVLDKLDRLFARDQPWGPPLRDRIDIATRGGTYDPAVSPPADRKPS